jgi:hypothetical protein
LRKCFRFSRNIGIGKKIKIDRSRNHCHRNSLLFVSAIGLNLDASEAKATFS